MEVLRTVLYSSCVNQINDFRNSRILPQFSPEVDKIFIIYIYNYNEILWFLFIFLTCHFEHPHYFQSQNSLNLTTFNQTSWLQAVLISPTEGINNTVTENLLSFEHMLIQGRCWHFNPWCWEVETLHFALKLMANCVEQCNMNFSVTVELIETILPGCQWSVLNIDNWHKPTWSDPCHISVSKAKSYVTVVLTAVYYMTKQKIISITSQ